MVEERDPIDAGRFHRHRGDAALSEVVAELLQVGGVGAEAFDLSGPDANDVGIGMDVDPGGVRMHDTQGFQRHCCHGF